MPKFLKPSIEIDVKKLSKENYSYREIQNKLKAEDGDISIMSICRILKNIGIRRQALSNQEEIPKFRRTLIKRTPEMVDKVKSYVIRKSPKPYRDIGKETTLTLPIISKIINQDLSLKTRR